MAHTQGWGIGYRRGKHLTGTLRRVIEIEGLKVRDPKEVKTTNPGFNNSKGFYYGKLNSVGFLRGGFGIQKTIYRKEIKNAIEVRYHLMGGPVLGFAKPIYLEILKPTSSPYEYLTIEEKYDPEKHFIQNIYGKAPFSRGLEQTKIHPGLFVKAAMSFDYGSRNEAVKALETGIVADFFPGPIPIMAFHKSKNIFVNLYIAFNFGKRWY